MECPICFEIISNSCYASCSHHFCYNCLKKWCIKGGIRCPMCKDRIYQIILDKEFDLINNPTSVEKLQKEYTKTIYVSLNDDILPGITLTDRKFSKEHAYISGVIVSNLEKNKKLEKYLKPGSVILYLNGIPCVKASHTIDVIKYYNEIGGILKIELEDTKENEDLFLLCCSMFIRKRNK